ncbi:MAG TPA: DHA2 family efflux MFS transporter permease subunit [Solirubrobacteraceae bacterium]|nr:DHA2 family efflux MFS transporter permease subunit [Solirubrobacteraceae bacterium]
MNSRQRWVLVLGSVASLMVALDALVVSTALGAIHRHLGASIDELEWTVNAYGLSFAVLLIPAAALGDRLGRRRLFAAGLGAFVLGSAACALAPNAGLLIAARAVQGSAAALVAPLSLSLVTAAFPPEVRGRAMGIFSGITGLAVLSGPVVGGAVTQGLAWQWVFWINVPIGLATIPLVLRQIAESYGPRARLDAPGLVLVAGAALGIVWGLMRGNAAGWGSAEVLGPLVAGTALLAAFVGVERRVAEPMLPPRLFAGRAFSAASAANFLLSCSLFSAVFFMAQFQQTVLHQGPLQSGLRLLPWTATLFVVAPVAGSLVNRIGERPLVVCGLALQAAGMAWIALIAAPGMAYWPMVAPLVLAGAGISMAIPSVQNAAMNAVVPSDLGKASGTFTTMRQLGGVFGLSIAVAVFAGAGSYGSAVAFGNGFVPAIAVAAAFSLAAAGVAALLPQRAAEPEPELSAIPEYAG